MSDRKKPGVAFWAAVVVAGLMAYPLSFGPACWLQEQQWSPRVVSDAMWVFYKPIYALLDTHLVPGWYWAYLDWWAPLPEVIY